MVLQLGLRVVEQPDEVIELRLCAQGQTPEDACGRGVTRKQERREAPSSAVNVIPRNVCVVEGQSTLTVRGRARAPSLVPSAESDLSFAIDRS